MRRLLVVIALLCCALGVGAATGSPTYEMTVQGTTDTPDRTVSIEGTDFEVTGVAERAPGQSMAVDVTVPDGTDYTIDLYNADEQVEAFKSGTGSGTVTFETDGLEPGTYMLTLEIDGSYEVVHPVVIAGYDLSLSTPASAGPNDSVTVTSTLEPTEINDFPNSVHAVLWGNGEAHEYTLTQTTEGNYEVTIDTATLHTGEYDVYAAVRGDETAAGYPTSLAIQNGGTFTIEENSDEPQSPDDDPSSPPSDDPDDPDDGSDGGESDPDSTNEGTENDTPDEPEDDDSSEATNESTGSIDDTDDDDAESPSEPDGTDNESEGPADNDSEILTPSNGTANETADSTGDEGDDTLAGSPLLPIVAILLTSIAYHRRQVS